VILDGTTQPGFSGTPLIVLKGPSSIVFLGQNIGLDIKADFCTIRGLAITGFDQNLVLEANGDLVEGNFLGADPTGGPALGSLVGLTILGTGNTVGGTTSA